MIKRLENFVFGTSRRLNYISGIALTVMMFLVFLNVLLRAVWQPILGTYEFTAFLASVTISFALANCACKKVMWPSPCFTERLSTRAKAVCEAIGGAIGASLFP